VQFYFIACYDIPLASGALDADNLPITYKKLSIVGLNSDYGIVFCSYTRLVGLGNGHCFEIVSFSCYLVI